MYLLTRRRSFYTRDPDASRFIASVDAADGQALEDAVKSAYRDFFLGCKADPSPIAGISNWDAIKACCILAGARTLAGALVPLKGTAPTNVGFTAPDYNRKTGLKGTGVNTYLNSNRAGNADPVNNHHISIFVSSATAVTATRFHLDSGAGQGNQSTIGTTGASDWFFRSRNNSPLGTFTGTPSRPTGFMGLSRTGTTTSQYRILGQNFASSTASVSASTQNYFVFAPSNLAHYVNSSLSFYSIGEAVDLAALDARVTTLMNALAAAIP